MCVATGVKKKTGEMQVVKMVLANGAKGLLGDIGDSKRQTRFRPPMAPGRIAVLIGKAKIE